MPPVDINMLPAGFRPTGEFQVNPLWPAAEAAFEDYARRTGIIFTKRDGALMTSFRFGYFTGACFVDLPQSELDLLTQWHYMLTITDDVADAHGGPEQARRLSQNIMSALRDPHPPQSAGPAVTAWHDLWLRTATWQPAPWRERALADLSNYLFQYALQRENRAQDRVFDLQSYIELRRMTVGLDINADALQAVLGIHPPEPLFATAPFRELRNCYVDANAWFNDYYSFEREVNCGEIHNLVIVLANAEGTPADKALETTLRMIGQRLETFLQLEARLPDLVTSLGYGPTQVREALRYTAALKSYTHGHVLWSPTSSRYNAHQQRATTWDE